MVAFSYVYFLGQGNFAPSSCILQSGLSCEDHVVENLDNGLGRISFRLQNSIGYDLKNVQASAANCGTGPISGLRSRQSANVVIDCSNHLAGSKYRGELNVSYENELTSLGRKSQGRITSKILG